ncbi:MAG TPA: hypothetical protein VN903_32690, partial [Polyangia bacterium]|nr:hypothetical protein [Polyangia bacterium]
CNRSKKRSTGSLTEAQTITLITHHRKLAVKLLNGHGLAADFSIGSIKGLDWMVDQDPEDARRGAEWLAVYLGEAIRTKNPGSWNARVGRSGLELELQFDNGGTVWPLQRVAKRITQGSENGLYGYALSLTEHSQ